MYIYMYEIIMFESRNVMQRQVNKHTIHNQSIRDWADRA